VLAFSGSERLGSWNARLLAVTARELESQGIAVTRISLRDHALVLYDGDLEAEAGVPAGVVSLRDMISGHDGMLVACPEYNGSVTPLLKNALDWCSRPVNGQGGLAPFQLKPVLIVATSAGPFGGIRAIGHLRAILGKMGAMVMPEDLAVPHADKAFSDDGFADKNTAAAARRAVASFAKHLAP
jgi:NAD(P)H-dependent FMN reductase